MYSNLLFTELQLTKNIVTYKKGDSAVNEAWLKNVIVTAALHEELTVDNFIIFPEHKTLILQNTNSVNKLNTRGKRQFKAQILRLTITVHYLYQFLEEELKDWKIYSSLAIPFCPDVANALKKWQKIKEACDQCLPHIFYENNLTLTTWIDSILGTAGVIDGQAESILQKAGIIDEKAASILPLMLGMTYYFDNLHNPTPEVNYADNSSSAVTLQSISCIPTKAECTPKCKLKLGLSNLSMLEFTESRDPLFDQLSGFSCMYLKGPSGDSELPVHMMELLDQKTQEVYLDNYETQLKAVPPDHETYKIPILLSSENLSDELATEKCIKKSQVEGFHSFYCEDTVHVKAITALKNKGPAFIMKNYNSSKHILPIKDTAKKLRETQASSYDHPWFVELNDKEKLVCSLIDLNKFIDKKKQFCLLTRELIEEAENNKNNCDSQKKKNYGSKEANDIMKYISKNLQDGFDVFEKGKTKKKKFNMDHLSEYVESSLYHYGCSVRAMEVDSLIFLPKEKYIINIESKSTKKDRNFKSKLEHGANQTNNLLDFFKSTQKDILSNWTFVKAVALPLIESFNEPDVLTKLNSQNTEICSYCKHFVLDQRKLDIFLSWENKLYI